MKRIIAFTLIFTLAFSLNTYASKLSPETQKLMDEAGIETNVPVDEIMRRQEAYKQGKANKSTFTQEKGQNKANRTSRDELSINPAIPNQDKEKSWGELRINSNYADDVYYNPDHGARYEGFDEFKYVWEMN